MDGAFCCVLKTCADELARVYAVIFNRSLLQSGVPWQVMCKYVLDFLVGRSQSVQIYNNHLLFVIHQHRGTVGLSCQNHAPSLTLHAHDCGARHNSKRREINNLVKWFQNNNLTLTNIKEPIGDFRK